MDRPDSPLFIIRSGSNLVELVVAKQIENRHKNPRVNDVQIIILIKRTHSTLTVNGASHRLLGEVDWSVWGVWGVRVRCESSVVWVVAGESREGEREVKSEWTEECVQ